MSSTYVGIESVGHQLKFSVRRDEGDGPVVVEPEQEVWEQNQNVISKLFIF